MPRHEGCSVFLILENLPSTALSVASIISFPLHDIMASSTSSSLAASTSAAHTITVGSNLKVILGLSC